MKTAVDLADAATLRLKIADRHAGRRNRRRSAGRLGSRVVFTVHGVYASMLIEIVVTGKRLSTMASKGFLICMNASNMSLEMLASLEALATARYLASVYLATFSQITELVWVAWNSSSTTSLGNNAGHGHEIGFVERQVQAALLNDGRLVGQ